MEFTRADAVRINSGRIAKPAEDGVEEVRADFAVLQVTQMQRLSAAAGVGAIGSHAGLVQVKKSDATPVMFPSASLVTDGPSTLSTSLLLNEPQFA